MAEFQWVRTDLSSEYQFYSLPNRAHFSSKRSAHQCNHSLQRRLRAEYVSHLAWERSLFPNPLNVNNLTAVSSNRSVHLRL